MEEIKTAANQEPKPKRVHREITQTRDEIRSTGKYAQEKMMNGMIMEGDLRRVTKYLESMEHQRVEKMSRLRELLLRRMILGQR